MRDPVPKPHIVTEILLGILLALFTLAMIPIAVLLLAGFSLADLVARHWPTRRR